LARTIESKSHLRATKTGMRVRLSCVCVEVRTGMPRPGLASRFIVCCFLGPGGFGWKSSIFTGWAPGWTGGRRALCRERQRSRVSAEELESSEAQGSRVTVVQITGWCVSGRAAEPRGLGAYIGSGRDADRWRRRKHLAEGQSCGQGVSVRDGVCRRGG